MLEPRRASADDPAHQRPAHGAVADREAGLRAIAQPLRARIPVIDTGDNLGHVDGNRGVERALAPFDGMPGEFVHGSNDVYGPVLKNPLRYFGAVEDSRQGRRSRPRHGGPGARSRTTARLARPQQHRARDRGARHPDRAFGMADAHRHWDRLDEPGAIARCARRRLERRAAERHDRRHPRALPADARRVRGPGRGCDPRRPHARRPGAGAGRPALVTNCDIPREQASGLSTWSHEGRSAPLNVSQGIGSSIFALFRLGTPPEAVVVSLLPRSIG